MGWSRVRILLGLLILIQFRTRQANSERRDRQTLKGHRPVAVQRYSRGEPLGRFQTKTLCRYRTHRSIETGGFGWTHCGDGPECSAKSLEHAQKLQRRQSYYTDHTLHGWGWYSRRPCGYNEWGAARMLGEPSLLEESLWHWLHINCCQERRSDCLKLCFREVHSR